MLHDDYARFKDVMLPRMEPVFMSRDFEKWDISAPSRTPNSVPGNVPDIRFAHERASRIRQRIIWFVIGALAAGLLCEWIFSR